MLQGTEPVQWIKGETRHQHMVNGAHNPCTLGEQAEAIKKKKKEHIWEREMAGNSQQHNAWILQLPFLCFSVTEYMSEPQPQTAWAHDSPDGNCHYSNRPGTLLQVSWSRTLCVKGRKQLVKRQNVMLCSESSPVQQSSSQTLPLGGCL